MRNDWMPFSLKSQQGSRTNTPQCPNINKLFCDRSSNFDLWLLLIILWTVWSKSVLYATQGSCSGPGWAQPYTPREDSEFRQAHVGFSPHKCAHTHTHTHTHTQNYYRSSVQDFWLVCSMSLIKSFPTFWPTGWGTGVDAENVKVHFLRIWSTRQL